MENGPDSSPGSPERVSWNRPESDQFDGKENGIWNTERRCGLYR